MVENMLARDAEEGIGAFLDKRDPDWTGRIAWKPRVSIITLGVGDLDRAVAFYEAMGLVRNQAITDGVAFFQMGGVDPRRCGRAPSWPRMPGIADDGAGFSGTALAYNTRSEDEVDEVLAAAEKAGGTHRQAGAPGLLGRPAGLFRRHGGQSLGGRAQPGFPDRRRRQHLAAAHEPRPLRRQPTSPASSIRCAPSPWSAPRRTTSGRASSC